LAPVHDEDPFRRFMVQIIRFHFVENLQRWRATYRAIKADAAENGRPTPAVYGNVHIVENAYSVIVSQYQDVVWTETPAFFPRVGNPTWGSPASGFSALQYKLGQSCGNFSKPHWGIVTLTGCGLAPTGFRPQDGKPQIMTSVLAAAEAVANGASAVMLLGDTVSADECLPAAQRWASFVDRHRHLFGPERHREADVVILCFPISFYLRGPRADCLLKLSVIHLACLATVGLCVSLLQSNVLRAGTRFQLDSGRRTHLWRCHSIGLNRGKLRCPLMMPFHRWRVSPKTTQFRTTS
jgi:hypothetical protein